MQIQHQFPCSAVQFFNFMARRIAQDVQIETDKKLTIAQIHQGLKYDKKIAGVIAKYNVACCLMHNRDNTEYSNFLDDFMEDMRECIRLAKVAGIADDKIILDPGVGFGKTYEMNLEIIDKLEIMQKLNYPILLGTSRKSVIGLTLDLPVDQREEGTLVTTVYGVQKGSAFVCVHDVKKNKRAIQMTKALMRDHEV